MRNSMRLSGGKPVLRKGISPLHFDRTAQCIHDAAELDEQPVAGGFDQTALVLGDFRIEELVA